MDRTFRSWRGENRLANVNPPTTTRQGGPMTREVPTTRYFAVGFFSAEQLEEKHRAMLASTAKNAAVPEIPSAMAAVHITVFNVDTGTETVEMGIGKVSMIVQNTPIQASGASFAVERFDSKTFPG